MIAIDPKTAGFVARRGATRLLRLVMADGRFIYRYNVDEKPQRTKAYNSLRHCGAAWSMLDTARQLGEMTAVAEASERAIYYLISNFIRPFGDDGGCCVVDKGTVKLGGSGLALLAVTELYRLNKTDSLLELARGLGKYITSQQRADGDFVHSRIYATGEERSFRSDYYTGEALFGLMRLHEVTGEENWLDTVVFSEERLLERDYGVEAQSHWMLYALEALYAARQSKAYLEHARRIAKHIVTFPGYRDRTRSTPIACRSEGLLAYVRLLERAGTTGRAPAAWDCVNAVRKNLEMQLKFKTANGAFICGSGRNEVRIDYIQHNISSFLAFSRLPPSLRAVRP